MTEDMIEGREIADLLPFFATDRLARQDKARVAEALTADAALRRELALVEEERDAAITANESLGAPSRAARDRFVALLDAQPQKRTARFDLAGWVEGRLEALRPRTLAWATCAVALVVAAQAGWIGTMVMSPRHATFETASVTQAAAPGTGALIIVAFTPDAKAQDIANLFVETSASIVAGPLPGGLYQVRIGDHPLSAADTDKIVAKLKAQTALVRFAAPGDTAPE